MMKISFFLKILTDFVIINCLFWDAHAVFWCFPLLLLAH